MSDDNKNLLLALILSGLVLFAWQFFYAAPQVEGQRRAQQAQQQSTPQGAQPNTVLGQPPSPSQAGGLNPPVPGTVPPVAAPVAETREAALARGQRVRIDTPSLFGSLSLRGGRIDDVALKNYRETVDPRSPNIVLFSPAGAPNPYYAEFGWVGGQAAVPTPETVWTADGVTLTPERPVTLTFDNGQGLLFRRAISVDARSMFTVKDTVENRTAAPVSLGSYGLVTRQGKPTTLGFHVLHEGLIGYLGGH